MWALGSQAEQGEKRTRIPLGERDGHLAAKLDEKRTKKSQRERGGH